MLFNLIINVISFSIKRVIVVFRVYVYAFYENCYFKKIITIKRVIKVFLDL